METLVVASFNIFSKYTEPKAEAEQDRIAAARPIAEFLSVCCPSISSSIPSYVALRLFNPMAGLRPHCLTSPRDRGKCNLLASRATPTVSLC